MKKRIVVTGMGLVSCFGSNLEVFYNCLLSGLSGVKPIVDFSCEDFPTKIAACVQDFNPEEFIEKKIARRIDKAIAYAVVSGKLALKHANLDNETLNKLDKTRAGIIVSSGMGGMSTFAEGVQTLIEKGPRRVSPFFVPYILTNMCGAFLGMDLGFMGPNYSISTACATSNYSIIAAADHIRNGDADLMICGGTEAAILPTGLAGFCACKALSKQNDEPTKASRPWDKDRDGFVMGEGAGVLILESLEHALARKAPIYAEYLGGGISCDAHHITEPRPDGEGVALCVKNALKDAGISPEDVNHINAHATSTPAGDMAEVNALKKVFTKNRNKISMNSTKSMVGHCLGASGAIEAIATIMAIKEKQVHPTINLDNPEENIEFHLPTKAESQEINIAISNSFGFGGHNATLVLGAYKE